MGMDIDEAGGDDAVTRRQFLAAAACNGADGRDAAPAYGDIGAVRSGSGSIDYQAIANDEIEFGHRSSR